MFLARLFLKYLIINENFIIYYFSLLNQTCIQIYTCFLNIVWRFLLKIFNIIIFLKNLDFFFKKMKGIQYSTTKELYEAKKILYEGSNATKKTFIVALASLVLRKFLLKIRKNNYNLDFFIFIVNFGHFGLCRPMDL